MIEERIEKVLSSISIVPPVICHDGIGPGLGESCSLPSISWLDSAQLSFIISSFPLLAQGRHHRTLNHRHIQDADISQNNPKKKPKISLWNPLQEPNLPHFYPEAISQPWYQWNFLKNFRMLIL